MAGLVGRAGALSDKGGRGERNREVFIFLAALPLVRSAWQHRHATQAMSSTGRIARLSAWVGAYLSSWANYGEFPKSSFSNSDEIK